MRTSPSMVPSGGGDTYLVLDDLGASRPRLARDGEEDAELETLIRAWLVRTACWPW